MTPWFHVTVVVTVSAPVHFPESQPSFISGSSMLFRYGGRKSGVGMDFPDAT